MEDALTFLLNLDGTCCQDVAVVGYDSVLQNEVHLHRLQAIGR